MQVEVIEQDGEKFIVLPNSVLEQCGIGDVADISVKFKNIVLKLLQTTPRNESLY